MNRWIVAIMGIGVMACGGGDSAEDKCDDLIVEACNRGVECLDASPGEEDECVAEVRSVVPCGAAKEVTASYDDCMDLLSTASCSTLFPVDPDTGEPVLVLPQICAGVVVTSRTQGVATPRSDFAGLRTVSTAVEVTGAP